MIFGPLPLAEAEGAILVHSVRLSGRLLKKGRVLSRSDLEALAATGVTLVTAARMEDSDVPEDVAALQLAKALAGSGTRIGAAFTGRTNVYSEAPGIVLIDPARIDAVNTIDEAITVATLAPFATVAPGEMLATVKIIPYAAPRAALAASVEAAARSPIRVAPFLPMKVGLISTHLSGQKPALLDKNRTSLEGRLGPLGGSLMFETRVPHETEAVAGAIEHAQPKGAEILFLFGASAIADRRDVIPAGIVAAGGRIVHFGMPVDPGNLLLLADLHGTPVVGLPSCARSPKVNGLDFVLQRLFARLPIAPNDIMRMGVGGLLQEIPSRPQLREPGPILRAPRIAAIVLAAGLSSRMGANKLLQLWRGKPLLRWTVEAALASEARPILVVSGHDAEKIEAALEALAVTFIRNPSYRDGLSSSLKAGLSAVPDFADGALVLLGDMPEISAGLIDRMIAGFSPADGRAICVATHEGRRGNPVLWARVFFPDMMELSGDAGAKPILEAHEELVCDIAADSAALNDIDTPDALQALRVRSEQEA